MAHGGEAVGRSADGRATFVAGGLPGETVEVVVTESRPRYQRGFVAHIVDAPSPARVEAPCPHFGAWPARGTAPAAWCGGCQWQHAGYEAQLAYKRSILVDALERIGGIRAPAVEATVGMPAPGRVTSGGVATSATAARGASIVEPFAGETSEGGVATGAASTGEWAMGGAPGWAYRNKLRTRLVGGRPGLVAVDGRTLVPIGACPIAVPALWTHVADFEADLPDGTEVTFRIGERTGDALIVIDDAEGVVGAIEVESGASIVLVGRRGELSIATGRSFYVEQFRGETIGVPATAFFQVNTTMAERLAECVQAALGPNAGRVVDAYCGIGTLTGAIAEVCASVLAVDIDAAAVAAAMANTAGLANVTLVEGDVAEALETMGEGADALVVDPPRGGLDADAGAIIARLRPPRIVYVSCEPTTLARDVRALGAVGYVHRSTQPLDMFPQTFHSESVTVLARLA